MEMAMDPTVCTKQLIRSLVLSGGCYHYIDETLRIIFEHPFIKCKLSGVNLLNRLYYSDYLL